VTPAVVNIAVLQRSPEEQNPLMRDPFFRRFFGGPGQAEPQIAAGSGVIVDAKNGYVMTNAHVVKDAREVLVTLKDNRRLPAKLVGADPGTDMGPLITAEHRDKVASYVDSGEREGATVVVDGRRSPVPRDGFFLGATLLDGVTPTMSCYRDEIFGPVLGVVRVDSYDEGVELINANPYANGTAIFTRDGGAARQFQFEVQVGMVGVNVPIPVPVAYYSFGGWKDSLFGDTHMYGPEGINFYTRGKVISSRWPDPATSSVDLGFPQTR
jgi:malonate-semialdehyde dehydrogenase (acetylating)/methylmalonate-semialdehyde dehydrogenase